MPRCLLTLLVVFLACRGEPARSQQKLEETRKVEAEVHEALQAAGVAENRPIDPGASETADEFAAEFARALVGGNLEGMAMLLSSEPALGGSCPADVAQRLSAVSSEEAQYLGGRAVELSGAQILAIEPEGSPSIVPAGGLVDGCTVGVETRLESRRLRLRMPGGEEQIERIQLARSSNGAWQVLHPLR